MNNLYLNSALFFPFVASTICPCVFCTKHFTCLIVCSLRSNPLTLQVWGQTLAVLIKIITRWGQRTRRAKSTESNGQEAAGDGRRYGYRMWHLKSKHVIVKKDKRTRARGRKQITCERSKSDRKGAIERVGQRSRGRTKLKACEGWDNRLSLRHLALRLSPSLTALSSPISRPHKIMETLKQSPVILCFLIGLQNP